MPRYRFSWDAFDETTVAAFAAVVGFDADYHDEPARAYLERKVKRPNVDFVRNAKDEIARTWLPRYAGAFSVVARLRDLDLGPGGAPRSQKGYAKYVAKTRNSKNLRLTLCQALIRFGDADRTDEGVLDFVPRFAVLDPREQPTDARRPHSYQSEAWEAMDAQLAKAESTGKFQGLLVMPTGAGKTFTAIRWLATRVLSRGGRVLWLAHRHELLRHAAAEFHRAAGSISGVERLRVRVVSGAHCAATQIDPGDHVVIASVGSLAHNPDVRAEVLGGENLFLVVDEAHHSAAKSYRDIINMLRVRKRSRVLGLTATPTRTLVYERPLLASLYGNQILYQVALRDLIERGTLSRPRLVHVTTDAQVEDGITEKDLAHFGRFDDLTAEWLDRIAHITPRNQVIVEHYLSNQQRYGKTLMFAINVVHAALLASRLCDRGVRADYVASYRPDDTSGDPLAVIKRFREGELDVLVNVQMVTEGVDVPDIQTVFLTRPTQSEILLRQMIGRALRGPKAGGTSDAFIVSFEDHWERFADWENPFELVPDLEEAAEKLKAEKAPRMALVEHLPWDLIRATAERIRALGIDQKADAFEAVPHGWYVLEREVGDEAVRDVIAVYEHQRPCWDALFDALDSMSSARRRRATLDRLFPEYFADCDDPVPSSRDVALAARHFRFGGERPEFIPLASRAKHDPYAVARHIRDEDLGERSKGDLLEARYGSLARAIYPTMREYRAAIEDALHELRYPDESTRVMRAVPIFDPGPEDQLSPGPAHDLHELLVDVLHAGADLEGVASLPHSGEIVWSRRILKGWYGKATWEVTDTPGGGRIVINRLLDSPDVSTETLRFLVWHEYLHLYLKQGHSKTFREKERGWVGWVACDRELDNLNERFGSVLVSAPSRSRHWEARHRGRERSRSREFPGCFADSSRFEYPRRATGPSS